MATITQRNGKWRVQIRMKGVSRSATFERASDAKAWAARIESQIMDGIQGNAPAKYYLCRPYPAVFIRGYTIKAGRTGRIIPHWTRTKNTFGKGAACRPAPSRLRRLARSTVAGGIPHQRRTRINHFIRRLRTRHERVGTSSRKPCTQNQQAEKKPGKDKTANRAGNCRYLRRPPIPA